MELMTQACRNLQVGGQVRGKVDPGMHDCLRPLAALILVVDSNLDTVKDQFGGARSAAIGSQGASWEPACQPLPSHSPGERWQVTFHFYTEASFQQYLSSLDIGFFGHWEMVMAREANFPWAGESRTLC